MTSSAPRLILLRHALAGSRRRWNGQDRDRPLDTRGERQSRAIARTLADLAPDRLLTSPYRRCLQTLEPFAAMSGIKLEAEPTLAEGAANGRVEQLLDALEGSVVLCTHGDVCPRVLAWSASRGVAVDPNVDVAKGAMWVLDHAAGVATLIDAPAGDREPA